MAWSSNSCLIGRARSTTIPKERSEQAPSADAFGGIRLPEPPIEQHMAMDPTIIDPAALARLEEWGGPKLSSEIIRLFLKHGPERMDQIRSALTGDDLNEAERGAHSLKSSAANVGAEEVRRIANDVEIASSEGEVQRVRDLVPNLEEAFTLALRELEMNVKEVK